MRRGGKLFRRIQKNRNAPVQYSKREQSYYNGVYVCIYVYKRQGEAYSG